MLPSKNFLLFSLVLVSLCSFKLIPAQEEGKKLNSPDSVFHTVETPPLFPGGEKEMFRFLAEELRYPQKAKENSTEGLVVISFIVELDGSLSNLKAVRSISPECDEESKRVIMTMPKWEPAMQSGSEVRVLYNLPIRFILTDRKKKKRKNRK